MSRLSPALVILALALAACKGDAASSADTNAASVVSTAEPTASAMPATATDAPAPAPAAAVDAGTSTQAAVTAGAWSYASAKDNDGTETRASIAGTSNGAPATLMFSDHDVWGRNVFLQPSQGDVECPVGCKVRVSVDGGGAQEVQASRPETSPPRLSLREPEALWKSIAAARTLTIEYPIASGTTKAEFDVAGSDSVKLPGWN